MTPAVVILDFGMGNLRSIQHKLEAAGLRAEISSDPAVIRAADALILPGVGHFAKGMENLRRSGLIEVLTECVLGDGKLIFGICLGMQMLTEHSEEGDAQGLGWVPGRTIRFRAERMAAPLKVPHVGWNSIVSHRPSPLLADIRPDQLFYFTHSYHVECRDVDDVLATTEYGYPFTSMFRRGNIVGAQFHPEKSHREGMGLVLNLIRQARRLSSG